MLTLCSILQNVCHFFRGMTIKVTKRMYRSSAVFMAGAAVITVVAFTSAGFGSGGKNVIVAFAETPASEDATEEDMEDEETVAKAKVQITLTDANIQLQQLASVLLEEEVLEEQESKKVSLAEITLMNTQIMMENEAKWQAKEEAKRLEEERIEAEEAARKAEEEKAANAMSISSDDYQVLLKIVQAEAGVCDDRGKILVANVILNRVKSSKFPDTVRGVVYSRDQFSPVSNGSINTVKVTGNTKACVDRALSGEDYSDEALYFMNRQASKGKSVQWFDSHLTFLFQHGNHEFFK